MSLYLRRVTKEDCDLLFEWANETEVRKNSFGSDLIKYDEHVAWFENLLRDDNQVQLIMVEDSEGEYRPIGQIRLSLDLINSTSEIGYSIAVDYRGKGYGTEILRLALEYIQENYPMIHSLLARVKPENIPSIKAFEANGYIEKYRFFEKRV